jgi:hypothetical protein
MLCRVLNFIEVEPPHSKVIIAQAVMECLAEWKTEDKVISLTLDNATSNDVVAKNLMAKFVARKVPGFVPHHFHVCCCAHIVNLVVQDDLQPFAAIYKLAKRNREVHEEVHIPFAQIC